MKRLNSLFPPANIALIFKISLGLLLVYQFLRLSFYLFNGHKFLGVSAGEIVYAFVHGIRFDAYSVFWLNAPLFLLLIFLPRNWQGSLWFRRLSLAWLFFVNCFFIGFNVGDWELVNFSGKRITMDIFFLTGEIVGDMGVDIVTFYWFQTLLGLSVFAGVFWYGRRLLRNYRPQASNPTLPLKIVWAFFAIVILAVGMRGGFQLKPIRPVNAFVGVSQPTGALVLNTTFTMLRSKRSGEFKTLHFFKNPGEVREALREATQEEFEHIGAFRGFNVVLIILESFSQEYTGLSNLGLPSYTPFLDELAKSPKARTFTSHFANGRRSIDAVPSLLAGIPTLMSEPFISSNYQTNRIVGWGQALGEQGYETAFFHGAKNGSMFFDSFSAQAGFASYYGLSQYTGPSSDNDGSWGVFDEPFFKYTVEQLVRKSKPFGAVLFSLSSHHPYNIPENYKGKFPEGELDIHESIGYTDHSLKRFFEAAEKTSWFENTVFIITADHTSKSLHPTSQTYYGAHRVPLIFYSPGRDLPQHPGRVFTQHVDVPKTIYRLLGVDPPMNTLFGSDIFALSESGYQGEVYNFAYPGYWYLGSQGLYHFDDTGRLLSREVVEEWHSEAQPAENTDEWPSTRMKAWLQYYNNGLIQNQWFTRAGQEP